MPRGIPGEGGRDYAGTTFARRLGTRGLRAPARHSARGARVTARTKGGLSTEQIYGGSANHFALATVDAELGKGALVPEGWASSGQGSARPRLLKGPKDLRADQRQRRLFE